MHRFVNAVWPILKSYDEQHQACLAMPLGGIGTGTVSLGGRGNLRDWEIANRPAKGYNGGEAIFVLWARSEGEAPVVRALEGLLQPPYSGAFGATEAYHGLPRFRSCTFHAAYPLAQVELHDPDVPLDVRLEAYNPMVPADPETSGLPVAILRYVLRNPGAEPVAATVCATMRNCIGGDGSGAAPSDNQTRYRCEGGLSGLYMTSRGVASDTEPWGTLALSTTAPAVTYRCAWPAERWGAALLSMWDDLDADGALDNDGSCPAQDAPLGSLAASLTLAPGEQASLTFLLTWHYPNRQTWTPPKDDGAGNCCCRPDTCIGNYYATRYRDAWEVAEDVAKRLPDLEERTLAFVRAFCESNLPAAVKEAALFNLSTLRSQTLFRAADGHYYGWEGCGDNKGCCHGSCTHVWNYEQASGYLYGSLARDMREAEFLRATRADGHMSFRVNLPVERAQEWGVAAADGQMGCIMRVHREWQLSGDDNWLRTLWPQVRRALEFCWVAGGWDADRDGVMEGCQHNTLDVEYYGPNPLMQGWYLGALRAAEEMARHLGEEAFASRCRALYERGRAWTDAHLFNGEYYEQAVRPTTPGQPVAEGLRHTWGAQDLQNPDYQVGPGCLVDQLVGQCAAHVCGLGHLLAPKHVRTALLSILRYNSHTGFWGHFNPMRSFALNDESALVMVSFPHGGRPRRPVPYFAEVMTGFEYAAAVHMLYEGYVDEGLRSIANIRARYDGARRNPFDEAECGHHYARAMASWGAVLALSGFRYSAVERRMAFGSMEGRHFWSTGYAWGTCEVSPEAAKATALLTVLHGQVSLARFGLTGWRDVAFEPVRLFSVGETHELHLTR